MELVVENVKFYSGPMPFLVLCLVGRKLMLPFEVRASFNRAKNIFCFYFHSKQFFHPKFLCQNKWNPKPWFWISFILAEKLRMKKLFRMKVKTEYIFGAIKTSTDFKWSKSALMKISFFCAPNIPCGSVLNVSFTPFSNSPGVSISTELI